MTGREPRHLRLEQREQLEVDIAKGVSNYQLMARYRVSYEQLKNFVDEMNRTPDPSRLRKAPSRKLAPCGTETAWDRHRRAHEVCVECEQEHELVKARRAASRRARRAREVAARRAEQDAMAVQRAEVDADKRLRGVA